MDSKDRQIIRALQRDGRMTNQDLAEAVNLSPSPCLRRVRLLEEAGVIRGYQASIDRDEVGLGLTVFVGIKVERHRQEQAQHNERRDIDPGNEGGVRQHDAADGAHEQPHTKTSQHLPRISGSLLPCQQTEREDWEDRFQRRHRVKETPVEVTDPFTDRVRFGGRG